MGDPERPSSKDSDEEPEKDAERHRPTSVRRGAPTPVRQAVPGGASARPTPVREAMEAERETPQPVEPPTLSFEIRGEEWIARTEGRSVTGLPTDPGAPLLFLTFARASEPESRVKEVVAVARRLDDIDPGRLAELFARARPFEGRWEGSELFPETRKGRPSRR